MAQLWGGRFENSTDEKAYRFNASIGFDRRLFKEDIEGSLAHAAMLCKTGILSEEEGEAIREGLEGILRDLENGSLDISEEYEDIHSFVEATLTGRVGDAGKKLHTGRSRNDQVALDMKLFVRNALDSFDRDLKELQEVLLFLMEEHLETVMPGFTHLQKAQPVTLSHHLGAYFEMLIRDRSRLLSTRERLSECPLGSGALAGTTYPLDREFVAQKLSFPDGPTRNSMDSVSDRDFVIEFIFDLSLVMLHLSRFSEEIIIWNSDEYRFVELSDLYSTGSSIMPQKKNPDIAELVRGKTGRVYGDLMAMLTTMKAIPLAYDKDMQEDKESLFDAFDTARDCVTLFAAMLNTARFNKERMRQSAGRGFTNATDAADYLVKKGVPFRDAHSVTGRAVLRCIELGIGLEELPLEEYRLLSPVFDEDIYKAIALETCVSGRSTPGAPSEGSMRKNIEFYKSYLEKNNEQT
ncbi:MAG: argininosuccinate lyase [Lachnospiraceae bacterium]|nr:argininosuccinate lyase [Lachnospiraceae bacterium]